MRRVPDIHLRFYRSLADSPATPTALAERTGCDGRYVREWPTAQAVAGLLIVAGPEPASALPQGRVGPDPGPVGTLIRPPAMLDPARRAGYADGQILPIEHPVRRFYRLVP